MISTICTRSGDSLELKVPEFVKTLYGVCTQDLRKFQGSNHLYTYYTSLMVDLDLCQDINSLLIWNIVPQCQLRRWYINQNEKSFKQNK